MLRYRWLLLGMIGVFPLANCSPSIGGPKCANVARSLSVLPAIDSLGVGGVVTLQASWVDSIVTLFSGPQPTLCSFVWSGSDTLAASVQPNPPGFGPGFATIRGKAPGSSTVTLSAGGKVATSTIVVHP